MTFHVVLSGIFLITYHMAVSSRIATLNIPDVTLTEIPTSEEDSGQSSELTDHELQLLDEVYQKIIPLYEQLSSHYQQALQRATNARKKSLFPCRSEWQLSQYPPGTAEREMLIGPIPSITPTNKVVCEDPATHRQICLTAAKSESPNSRHSCS